MPRAVTTKPFYSFNGGINTEANPANYPENAALDLLNIDLNSNGVASRRKTLKAEGFEIRSGTSVTSYDHRATFYWKNANNEPGRNLIVQQFNRYLRFFDIVGNNAGENYLGTVQLTAVSAPYSFAAIDGDLIVLDPSFGAKLVEFDGVSTFTFDSINLRIRDFEGVDDGLSINEHPAGPKASFPDHWYNLRNQGWIDDRIDIYQSTVSAMPSNSEIWHVATSATDGSFGAAEVTRIVNFDWGNTPAPRGRETVGVYNPSLDRQNGNPDIYLTPNAGVIADESPSIVAAYASRLFYAQSSTNIASGRVLYTQIPETTYNQEKRQKYGACFQKNDPTADTFNTLLETDGGVIEIPDLGKVKAMGEINGSLVVFSDQGVWAISGADSAFTATNLAVRKVSNIGLEKKTSVVFTGDQAFFPSGDAIYRVSANEITSQLSVVNITDVTIKTLLRGDLSGHAYIQGVYDKVSNKAIWLYQKELDPMDSSPENDYLLILDLSTGAFSKYSIGRPRAGVNTPFAAGIVAVGEGEVPSSDTTYNSSYANTTSTNTLNIKIISGVEIPLLFVCEISNFIGDPGGDDSIGGVGNNTPFARLQTGPQTLGDASRDKDITYLTTVFNRTESEFEEVEADNIILTNQSGCLGKIYWDWSDGKDNRFSPQQQLYRLGRTFVAPDTGTDFDYGKQVITTKTKMRGSGKSFTFEFTSQPGKDFQLVGWSIETTAGAAV